jgi:hypothetical protein
VLGDGSLTDRQVYGTVDLGGRPDGMTFDAYSNLWIIGSILVSHHLPVALPPVGDVLLLSETAMRNSRRRGDQAERAGGVPSELIELARGRQCTIGRPGTGDLTGHWRES